jgi:hypothetical protein
MAHDDRNTARAFRAFTETIDHGKAFTLLGICINRTAYIHINSVELLLVLNEILGRHDSKL